MAFGHGSKGVFKLDNSSGALVDLSQYITGVEFPRDRDTVDVSTLGDTNKDYIAGLRGATISLEGNWDATQDAHFEAVLSQTDTDELSVEYGPAGSTTGLVKYTCEAILTAYSVSTPVGDAQKWTATLQVTGAVTRTTWA